MTLISSLVTESTIHNCNNSSGKLLYNFPYQLFSLLDSDHRIEQGFAYFETEFLKTLVY